MYSSKKIDRVHILYSTPFDDISKYGIKSNSGAILSQGLVIGNNTLTYPGNLTYSSADYDSLYYNNTLTKNKILSIPSGITWTENKLLKTSSSNCNFSDIDVDDYNNISNIATIGGITGNITSINTANLSCAVGLFGTIGVTSLYGKSLTIDHMRGALTLLPRETNPTGLADTLGTTGNMSYDDNYLYIKTSVGWKRVSLSAF